MKYFIMILISISLLVTSCSNVQKNETTQITKEEFSILGKWYTTPDDDRFYYEFNSNGNFSYYYYKRSISGNPVDDIVEGSHGKWEYINDDFTSFFLQFYTIDDNGFEHKSCKNKYEVAEENDMTLTLKGIDGTGDLKLYKTAKNLADSIPEEISKLVGTWYYDESKTGRYLNFQTDRICWHYYYSNSLVTSNGPTSGWISTKGLWSYVESDNTLSITMSGEISHYYKIEKLTDSMLLLKKESSVTTSQIETDKELIFYK